MNAMKFFRHILQSIYLLIIVMVVCGFFASKGSDSGSGSTLPKCKDVVKSTEDISFKSVELRYDLSTVANHALVVNEFMGYHKEIFSPTGSIRDLTTILENSDLISEADRRPIIRAEFSSSSCTGNLPKDFKADEIQVNKVFGVPGLGVDLSRIDLSIKSYKSAYNNIQLCWEATINVTDRTKILIDADSKVTCDCCWDAATKTGVGGQYIAARRVLTADDICYEEIPNGNNASFITDGLKFIISIEDPVVSPILDGPIYREGEKISELAWDKPVLIISE